MKPYTRSTAVLVVLSLAIAIAGCGHRRHHRAELVDPTITSAAEPTPALPVATRHADEKQTCVRAYTDAQTFRQQQKLVAAREQLRICSGSACSPFMSGGIVKDCAEWLREVEASLQR